MPVSCSLCPRGFGDRSVQATALLQELAGPVRGKRDGESDAVGDLAKFQMPGTKIDITQATNVAYSGS